MSFGPIPGYDFLGSTALASAAVTTGAVAIEARDVLLVQVRVTGYSGADTASLRFNADAGATSYRYRYLFWTTAATPVLTQQQTTTGAALARLFAQDITQGRSAQVAITNNATTTKIGAVNGMSGSSAVGTQQVAEFGGFEWFNTTAQITSIEMRTAGGTITLSAGSGFAVFGRNL